MKMREILFRGKSIKSNQWVYGHFVESEGVCFIYSKNENLRWLVTEVIPESVGQSSGFSDRLGSTIFEGCKCEVALASGEHVNAFVKLIDGCFDLCFIRPILVGRQYNDRDYLKCHTINHAVTIIEPEEIHVF